MSTTTDTTVATTILDQMGGAGRIMAMTGARQFGVSEDSVTFKFANRKRSKPNHITIKLDATDTYTVTFARLGNLDFKVLSEQSGIYADMLIDLFESATGLYLSI